MKHLYKVAIESLASCNWAAVKTIRLPFVIYQMFYSSRRIYIYRLIDIWFSDTDSGESAEKVEFRTELIRVVQVLSGPVFHEVFFVRWAESVLAGWIRAKVHIDGLKNVFDENYFAKHDVWDTEFVTLGISRESHKLATR